jgi:hypothetical protein
VAVSARMMVSRKNSSSVLSTKTGCPVPRIKQPWRTHSSARSGTRDHRENHAGHDESGLRPSPARPLDGPDGRKAHHMGVGCQVGGHPQHKQNAFRIVLLTE